VRTHILDVKVSASAAIIDRAWDEVAGAVGLSSAESDLMRLGPGAQILNPFLRGAG